MESNMHKGWAGSHLSFDLEEKKSEREEFRSEVDPLFLGGRGTISKIFWDRVPVETEAFSPKNLLIFGPGFLTGTNTPAANRTIVTTKSPSTNMLTYSAIGGFWASEMRKSGYDSLSIYGKSQNPVYFYISGNHVEIRDASHLWGKDTNETKNVILNEVKDNRAKILCIGPAGENRVYVASIEHSAGASASRAGIGAVMGDKKVKAIVVRGDYDIKLAHPEKYKDLCKKILKRSGKLNEYLSNYSKNRIQGHVNAISYGNMGDQIPWPNVGEKHSEFLKKSRIRKANCSNCPISCKSEIRLPDGRSSFVKCTSWFVFMAATKIRDFSFNMECFNLCERYGLDSTSTANLIAFAIDLFQKGILTEKDTEGLCLKSGDPKIAFALIEKIAFREGIGDLLANGVKEVAKEFGQKIEKNAFHVKGLEILPFQLYTPYMAYASAVSDRADMMKALGQSLTQRLSDTQEAKKNYIQSGFFPYPNDFKKYLWAPIEYPGEDYERYAKCISYEAENIALSDCVGTCIYWTGHYPFPPFQDGDIARLVSFATGIDFDTQEVMKIAKRVTNLIRSYHLLSGMTILEDTVPMKFFEEAPNPPKLVVDRGKMEKLKANYYKIRGWNKNGIPKKSTLKNLNLDFVLKAFEKEKLKHN